MVLSSLVTGVGDHDWIYNPKVKETVRSNPRLSLHR